MRWSWLLCIAIAAPIADAAPRRDAGSLWGQIADPHGAEVRSLVSKARTAMDRADEALGSDAEWAADERARFYRDAYNLCVYARSLAPENIEALGAFARAADELGKTSEALQALQRSVRLTGADKASLDVVARLGTIHLRLGELDAAVRWLRLAQQPGAVASLDQAYALVHLANALAARGEMAAAIYTLSNALPDRTAGIASPAATITAFALAVLYDRDEQRAAAFELLDQMQTTMSTMFQAHVQLALAQLPFTPAEDIHYFRALLYEVQGHYIEARAEWAHYAASSPQFRTRALDHVSAIDAQRRARRGAKPLQPGPILRKLPTP